MANQNKTVSNYYASYYSGTDIRIYFGDMWLDEIVEIQWSVQEQVAPIFGYSSFTWDKVARGNRIVQGSFSINFKEVGYLQTILNSLSSNLKEKKQAFDSSKWEATFQPENNVKYGKYYSRSDSVEYIIDNFAEMSDEYEMAIWGVENNSSTSIDSRKHDTLFMEQVKTKIIKSYEITALISSLLMESNMTPLKVEKVILPLKLL
ncbi:hypothetical protein AAAC51_07870 [Priestia megaterium]